MLVKDHMYDSRIVDIKFHEGSGAAGGGGMRRVISSDRHIVKVPGWGCGGLGRETVHSLTAWLL
jgi:hypothetical protein